MLLCVHRVGALGNGGFVAELAHGAVQLRQVLRNELAFGVVPWPSPDAVARVHAPPAVGPLRAQISAPRMVARTLGLCQRLAMRVGSGEPPKVAAIAKPFAGDEEPGHRFAPSHRNR